MMDLSTFRLLNSFLDLPDLYGRGRGEGDLLRHAEVRELEGAEVAREDHVGRLRTAQHVLGETAGWTLAQQASRLEENQYKIT
jgi:hypothetical protein